jgi:hypothetical protein
MSAVVVDTTGSVQLPLDVCQRQGLLPNTSVRVIETRVGVLLVPEADQSLDSDLQAELAAWQSMGQSAWEQFPYEEAP